MSGLLCRYGKATQGIRLSIEEFIRVKGGISIS